MSLRDQILASDDIAKQLVEVPEWGLTVEVRGMTGADRSSILANALDSQTGLVDFRVMYPEIVIAAVYDPETGERVFTANDRDAILTKSATALDKVAQVAMSVGGLTQDAQDDAGKRFPDESES